MLSGKSIQIKSKAPGLCHRFFFSITSINLGNTCLFRKGFSRFSSVITNRNRWHYHTQIKHAYWVKTKENSISQNQIPLKKVSLELFHQILGLISKRLLLAGDTANVWQDIELRVDPDPFCKSCQIFTINKKPRSNTPLKSKTPFKWVFVDIIPYTSSTSLTKDTNFSN